MKYDILKLKSDVTEVKILANKISGIKKKNIEKSAARAFKDGKIYSAALIGVGSDSDLLARAEHGGNVGLPYSFDLPQSTALQSFLPRKNETPAAVEKFIKFFKELQSAFPNLNFFGAAKFDWAEKNFYGNYTGNLHSGGESVEWYLLYKRFGIADFADGYISFRGTHFDFEKIVKSYGSLIDIVDSKASIESKKMPVLLMEPGDFANRLSKDLNPERFHGGTSALSNKLGQKIFSPLFSLKDVSYDPAIGRFDRFDEEGVVHNNPSLFKDGVFTGMAYDLRQAQKAGKQSTGNGRRAFDSGSRFGFFELTYEPGKDDVWDMIHSLRECLVVVMGYGGDISDDWEYSTPVQVGYLYRHGKPVGRVPAVSIKGELKKILGEDLLGVSRQGLGKALMPAILTQMEVIGH